jgi:hypothetical protein
MSRTVPTASAGPSELLPPTSWLVGSLRGRQTTNGGVGKKPKTLYDPSVSGTRMSVAGSDPVPFGPCHACGLSRQKVGTVGEDSQGMSRVVGEEGHESDRPHRIGRTERAPSADPLGCLSACVAAGLNLESEKNRKLYLKASVLRGTKPVS